METEKKINPITSAWQLWCGLPTEQRKDMTAKLGSLGQLLNIATNVQKIVETTTTQREGSAASQTTETDDDIIDVEWEESK